MQDDKLAKILLSYASIRDYILDVLTGNQVDYYALKRRIREELDDNVAKHEIKELWEELDLQGYDQDEIIYDTVSEALDDQRNRIVEAIAKRYVDTYFGGDDYFLEPLKKEIDRVSYNVDT